MKSLIFGANGQDGHYLEQLLRSRGFRVTATSRNGPGPHCDVCNRVDVQELVKTLKPSLIFHLAANSTTYHQALFENHDTIATGALNILEAVKQFAPSSKVFLTGSGLQFQNTGEPISETDPFEAGSPYALARIHSTYAARYYRSLGISAYVGYLFHHESPLRKPGHVSQIIAQAALRISQGSSKRLELGDITVEKEWTFAGDVVEGMLALLGQDQVFEATIGSGVTHSIREWLDLCFSSLNLDWQEHVAEKEGFKAEYPRLVSDPSTIRALGWSPRTSISDLARMMLSNAAAHPID